MFQVDEIETNDCMLECGPEKDCFKDTCCANKKGGTNATRSDNSNPGSHSSSPGHQPRSEHGSQILAATSLSNSQTLATTPPGNSETCV